MRLFTRSSTRLRGRRAGAIPAEAPERAAGEEGPQDPGDTESTGSTGIADDDADQPAVAENEAGQPGEDEEPEESDEPDEPEEPEDDEPVDDYEVVAVDPTEVALDLANRLAAIDRAEMLATQRNLAILTGRGLHAVLQAFEGGLWIAGPRERPLTRPLGWALLDTSADRAMLSGTVSREQRANGIGGALLSAALGRAAEEGRGAVTAMVWDASEGEEFLWRHGFGERRAPTTVRRLEVLATKARRSRIVEDAQTYATAYQLLRESEQTDHPGGGTRYRVHARHAISGAPAGQAELTVLGGAPEHAVEAVVAVQAEHRGNRLGVLLLGELLHWIETDLPGVRTVQSSVPANLTHAIAVLDRLGYRIAGVQLELRRQLR